MYLRTQRAIFGYLSMRGIEGCSSSDCCRVMYGWLLCLLAANSNNSTKPDIAGGMYYMIHILCGHPDR